MGGVCTCICVCVCVLGKHAQMCILKEAALTSCAFCECSPHYTVRLHLSLEPRTHWALLRQRTSRDPISKVQIVRLYTSHCARAEFRQMLGIWAAVFMGASIHWFIFSTPKHILTCFILTCLVYEHAHTRMYATVNVWQSNYDLTKPVPSFHHVLCFYHAGLGIRLWSLVAGTFAHQAVLLTFRLLLYLTRVYLLSHSFAFAYF